MKLDLLTNATVVDDAIRFVSSNTSKYKETSEDDERARTRNDKRGFLIL